MKRTSIAEENGGQSHQHLLIWTPSGVCGRLRRGRDPLQTCEVKYKQGDRLFVTRILLESSMKDLRATFTISQKLAEEACQASEMQKELFTLSDCAKGFESVFTKEDFNILLEHRQWDHAIELVPGSEP